MRVKLTNTQLNKSKSATKNKTETILRLNEKNFEDEELQHELRRYNILTTSLCASYVSLQVCLKRNIQ